MNILYAVLIVLGIVGLLLAGLKKDFTQFSPGWLGAALIAIALLLQIVIVVK